MKLHEMTDDEIEAWVGSFDWASLDALLREAGAFVTARLNQHADRDGITARQARADVALKEYAYVVRPNSDACMLRVVVEYPESGGWYVRVH